MAFVPINLDGQLGMIRDVAGHLLQPPAWTDAKNARMDNRVAGTFLGHVERYASPTVDPYKLFYVPGESALFWVMAGLDDIIVHDGSVYSNITRPVLVDFVSGSVEPTEDDILTGATSGATGKVYSVTVDSGTWGGGDAAGTIELYDVTGTLNASENLDNTTDAASNVATTDSAPTGGIYTGDASDRWNGGVLSGVLVVNNSGVNDPQYWASAQSAQRLADLPNWPTDTKAKIIRPFKNFLVALDVTSGGVRRPYQVKWSHSADPGSVPTSWDKNDATKDAGEFDLGETKDFLVDCLPLGADLNVIYKEQTTWGMQFIGHPFIFKFFNIFGGQGMFTQQCGVEFKSGRHAVLTRGDFIVHNGGSFESVIDGRNKKWLFQSIDPSNWELVFVSHNIKFNEVWICYPSIGSDFCDQALVWNYRENTWFPRDLPQVTDIALGIVNPSFIDTWDGGDAGTWNSGLEIAWDSTESDPTRYRPLAASPDAGKVYEMDRGHTFDGVEFTTYLERNGLAVEPVKRGESLTQNYESWKFLRGVRPRFIVPPAGETVQVWVGTRNHINAETVWEGPYITDADQDYKVDVTYSGRLFGIRFQLEGYFEIDGYDLDIELAGLY